MSSASSNTVDFRSISLCFIVFLLVSSFGYAQNCSGELTVDKSRNVRSADQEGTQFLLTLKNTSSEAQTYELSSVNLKESCATTNSKTTAPNVDLNVSILEMNASRVNEVSIRPGSSKKIKIQVDVPEGTPFKTWSCIEIQAKAKACNTISSSTILKVFVPDTSDE